MVLMPSGRKAVFFTLATIFFVTALALLFSTNQPVDTYDTKAAAVYTLDAYRDKLESVYIPLLTKHYSYQAMQAMSQEAYDRPLAGYLSLPADFNETVVDGTLRGIPIPDYVSLSTAFVNLSNITDDLGYNLSLVVYNVSVNQIGRFEASYTANVSFNLSTRDGSVYFQRNLTVIGTFSLVGVPDLYYNREIQAIIPSSEPRRFRLYDPTAYDNANFAAFVSGGYYRGNNESPSIFNRLQGITTQSPWGVESVIPDTFSPANNFTSIDYEYFEGNTVSCTYIPSGHMNMRLALTSVFDYGLTGTSQGYNSGSCAPGP